MAAIGGGSLLLLPRCVNSSKIYFWRFFTEKEAKLVDSLVEQIIPTDKWPGAKDAGVTNYIDKQLSGPLSRHQKEYRQGLVAITQTCQILYEKLFEELLWDEQTIFLKKMESGFFSSSKKKDQSNTSVVIPQLWEDNLDRIFFGLICKHTMQGFYGSPRHGGNKNYVSYRMIGLDYPLIIGQNRYKN